jgi:hypothetical protein
LSRIENYDLLLSYHINLNTGNDLCACKDWFLLVALCFQEWPEEDYPPYANGPGYILSYDIAHYIVSEFEKHKLRVSVKYRRTLSLFFFIWSSSSLPVHITVYCD